MHEMISINMHACKQAQVSLEKFWVSDFKLSEEQSCSLPNRWTRLAH